ncbi:stemmadenine O-acetyltransferase-like [Silene latifolia]|uniref:stemmadenine O-acetyltransferase-like n=1 Tax=Silene latifolia TaxID=37657 RepID=UPI003D783C93
MAKFKVEIKSKDMIKPLSETPNHLKTLQLTFIDQLAPPVLLSSICYYKTPLGKYNNPQTTTTLLKNSLSKTLVQFYPLAGRVVGNSSIDCNDEGVEFYEADVLASLVEVIANPDPEELIRLSPYAPNAPVSNNISLVTAVQEFLIMLDKLFTFDSASFLPPLDLNGIYDHESPICKEKIVTRRLVFNKEKLDELKKKADDGHKASPLSRVAVVSAFLWIKLMKIARAKPKPPKMSSATQAVNLRTIRSSPFRENCYGNLFWTSFVHTPIESDFTEVVGKLKGSSKKINTSLLQEIETGECVLELQEAYNNFSEGEVYFCGFTSWTKLPLYELDFGWGAPVWVSPTTIPFQNAVVLLNTKCGQGIEAWVNVLEQDAAMLEQDHEIHSLASHGMRAKL